MRDMYLESCRNVINAFGVTGTLFSAISGM